MNIKELAEQANRRFEEQWPGSCIWYWDELAKFAELVAAREREECAKVCEQQESYGPLCETPYDCAAAIRARSKA